MRLIVLGILGLACAAAGVPNAGGSARLPATRRSSRDSAAIVTLEHTWLRARDTTVLARILAPGFVHITPGGYVLTRHQHLAWVEAHPPGRDVRRRFGSLRVRVYGDAAVANGIVVATEGVGRAPKRTAFTDVFVKHGGRWWAVNAQEDVVTHRQRTGT